MELFAEEVNVQQLPLDAVKAIGLPDDEAAFLQRIWEVCDGFEEEFVSEKTYVDLGRPKVGIREAAVAMRDLV